MSRQWIFGGLAVAVLGSLLMGRTYASSTGGIMTSGSTPLGNLPRAEIGSVEQIKVRKNMANSELLGGKERFSTFISTDKPIYRAGENVYVRGVLLDSQKLKPISAEQSANARIEITGPKGDVVGGGTVLTQDSTWGFAWKVPEGQAGGQYLVKATYPFDGHAPAERKFDIRAYRAPRLKSQITFLRDGYGPGEKVSATLDVKRAEGGVPVGAKVTVTARVDGVEVRGATARVDEMGLCSVSFDLPGDIPRGEGTLSLIIEDGGVVETAAKTIPILLQTVDLKIFPEGGELIAGFPNRVYIQANQPNGKPADLSGKVMAAATNSVVAEFSTEHEGRGRFQFTPEAGKEYYLTVSQPAGIKTQYPLPAARADGALLRAAQDVCPKGQPVTVLAGATHQKFSVTLAKCEKTISECQVDLSKRSDVKPGTLLPITFEVPADAEGVLTATVWSEKDVPLAERLVFRQPAHPLKVSISADKKTYVPGDTAKLTVKATDENGKPVSAVVGVTVTDDSVLEMIEKREQAPQLPVMAFLESEVSDLADAHVYLDSKNPKAPLATDLLLGTQGWRRFALMDLAKFIEANGDKSRRLVALKIQARHEVMKAMKEDGMVRFRGAPLARPGGFAGNMVAAPMALGAAQPVPVPVPAPAQLKANGAPDRFAALQERKARAVKAELQQAGFDKVGLDKDANEPAMIHDKQLANPAEERVQLQNAIGMAASRARRQLIADAEIAADEVSAMPEHINNLVLVREYAFAVRADRKPGDRIDFSETLFWNSGVKTDAATGEATISFGLNDSVSTFRVFADAFAGDGSIGAGDIGVESVQPFYAELKMPLEVTAGDRVLLPISLVNATSSELASPDINVGLPGDFKLSALLKNGTTIGAGGRVRYIQPIDIGAGNGTSPFALSARSGLYADSVTRSISVKPKGFPIEQCFGGILEPGKPVVHTIKIPGALITGSMSSKTAVYPTPLANMTEALERLIQDPYGCFEQTCSTSYPLTMAQQYFLSHTGVNPKLVESSKQKLDVGYKKLVSFWCPDKGYEWFGENPGHEALTAFGLLHFTDMAQVREVDKNMIASTRSWLFKQRDGKGGFSRKRRALHTWIEDKDCSNAYILWAMLETGQPASDLTAEIGSLKSASAVSSNNYVVALAANALHLAGDKAEAKKLMAKLAAKQKPDGSIADVRSSIVGSNGEALAVEGASLATLAWMREPEFAGNVEKSIKFLADSCKAGRYGSTQSTVLALRAIVHYDQLRARPKVPGKVRVFVDGQSVGDWASFTPATEGAITLPDLSELLPPGEHKLELRMEGGSAMPYSMAVKYNAVTPQTSDKCRLDMKVALADTKLTEGAATEANVVITNREKEVLPTPLAIVGLPGGLEPRHDQLKELVKKGKIDAYEVLGREVVLYWRTLPAEARVEIPISLIAAVPGTYTGPASRSYLYYTDEHKQWVEGLKVEIAAK